MDNILDMLDETTNQSSKPNFKKKKKNMWDAEVEPIDFDLDSMRRNNQVLTTFVHGDVPREKLELAAKFLKLLDMKNYTLRTGCDRNDTLSKIAIKAIDKKEYYLPWKSFNKGCVDLTQVQVKLPGEKPYGLAAKFKPKFNDLPPVVRAILARNVEILLGTNGDRPVDFVICYSEDGVETASKISYKTTGNLSFIITVAEAVGIPIFNLGNESFKENFQEFLKNK